ncbi:MAG TPA: PKD domain-containing protein [Solirubrobacteraceae bacterium]|nr:PKD domain-containing protein [Solirubrobacteraceae bacterium]
MAAGVFLAGGLPVAAASASPGWLVPVNLAEEEHEVGFGPFVGMDAQGDALAAWEGSGGGNETFRAAGGSWQPPGSLTGEGQGVEHPCVVMSSVGEALALWAAGNGKDELVIEAASKPAGGSWQAPVTVAEKLTPRALLLTDCHVAIDSAGDAVAVWSVETEFEFEEVWAAYRPAGGSWQAAVEIQEPCCIDSAPAVAIDSQGNATAVWVGSGYRIDAEYKPAGENWRKPKGTAEVETLSESGHAAFEPRIAFDEAGDAVAAWMLSTGESYTIQTASRPHDGSWQAPVDMSEAGQDAYAPSVALDSAGNALAVWELESDGHSVIQQATRPSGETWGTPSDLSAADGYAYNPQLAIDPKGDAVAVWEVNSDSTWTVQANVKPDDEGWGVPSTISEPSTHAELFPQIAVDYQGDALAAWELYDGTSYLIQAAGYQAAGPQLQSLDIPSTGTAGEPVGFSVSPLDVWAALRATRWSFGDGGSATGTSVTHTYAAAGAYQVTLTGEDVLGNTSSGARTITISSAPPTPTPTPMLTPMLTLTPPTIAAAGQSASIWREGSRLASLARKQKPPVGTTFSFTLNEQASVRFAFTQQVGGRTVNGKCVAQSKKHRHKPACERTVTAGTLSFTGHAGTNKVSFQGRISATKKLAPGKYTLVITATNAAGRRSNNANSLRFTIVK